MRRFPSACINPPSTSTCRAGRPNTTLLKNKVLFGSDYPLITPDRWLADFEKIAIRDEVRPLILKENAIRLFGGLFDGV